MTTQGTEESRGRGVAVRDRERRGQAPWPDEMERFFDRVMRNLGMWPRPEYSPPGRWPSDLSGDVWLPEMDVFEQDNTLVINMDIPGIKREDIDVAVEGDMLVIQGQREEEREVNEEDYYCRERASGMFCRAVMLPDGVAPDAIEAAYQDGVLEVRVPYPAGSEVKRLKVPVK